jgi:neutral ceramidase
MRLRSRAFVFRDHTGESFVYVSVELGQITQAVVLEVVKQLQASPLCHKRYTMENVMLNATHTHCAPGGLSHYTLYNLHPPQKGFDVHNFKTVTSGIVASILRAHVNIQPAHVRIAKGKCLGASVNRSPEAYDRNPLEERQRYDENVDSEMVLLRIDAEDGQALGMINW